MRTIEDVQRDYAANATQLGDVLYRVSIMEQDASKLRRTMKNLNQEAAGIKNAEHNASLTQPEAAHVDTAKTE